MVIYYTRKPLDVHKNRTDLLLLLTPKHRLYYKYIYVIHVLDYFKQSVLWVNSKYYKRLQYLVKGR